MQTFRLAAPARAPDFLDSLPAIRWRVLDFRSVLVLAIISVDNRSDLSSS